MASFFKNTITRLTTAFCTVATPFAMQAQYGSTPYTPVYNPMSNPMDPANPLNPIYQQSYGSGGDVSAWAVAIGFGAIALTCGAIVGMIWEDRRDSLTKTMIGILGAVTLGTAGVAVWAADRAIQDNKAEKEMIDALGKAQEIKDKQAANKSAVKGLKK